MMDGSEAEIRRPKMSSEQLEVSSTLRGLMLFLALATSTMQYFAIVILLPLQSLSMHSSINTLEMGLIIAAQTAGSLVAYRNVEPFVSKFGIKWSLQVGFLILIASSFAFWLATFIDNDSNFATAAFLARFGAGFGSGLLNAVCLLVRVSGQQFRDAEPDTHFRWHLQGEGFGYLMGPLFVVAFY